MKKILIVDDEQDIVESLKFVLEAADFTCYCAYNGEDGLRLAKEIIPDLIILDVMMPNMNGWETLKAIRRNEHTKHLPVIMLTAVNEEQKMVTGLKIGADDYIVKPFVLPNLLARMEAVLRRSIRQKEIQPDTSVQVPLDLLTSKEKEVLQMVAKGESNKQIAEKMFVKEVTVKTHLNSIFKKLKVANRTQAVLIAMQTDLIK